jgi:hypothetical protein
MSKSGPHRPALFVRSCDPRMADSEPRRPGDGLDAIEVTQSQHEYLCAAHPHYREAWEASSGRRYANFLAEVVPKVARPFLEELLSLVLRKA